jgi:hypothetical protein
VTVRLKAEDATTITVAWDRPAGQWGYVPTIDGSEILSDGKRHIGKSSSAAQVKIGKVRDGQPHRYGVVLLVNGGAGDVAGKPAGALPPPSPDPVPPSPFAVTKIAFAADHAMRVSELPATWRPAYTADPYYEGGEPQDYHSLASIIAQHKAELRPAGLAWGNQSQIGVARIKAFRVQYGLAGEIYQCENGGELRDLGVEDDGSIRPGSLIDTEDVTAIGSTAGWTQKQRDTVVAIQKARPARFRLILEAYANLLGPFPKDASAQGINASSECLGLYDGASEVDGGRYVTPEEYHANTPDGIWAGCCVYHVGGARPGDLAKFPA